MAISPDDTESVDDELRPEYDFRSMRGVVRGKYAARDRERLTTIEPLLAEGKHGGADTLSEQDIADLVQFVLSL